MRTIVLPSVAGHNMCGMLCPSMY